jgi:hypothetical protein
MCYKGRMSPVRSRLRATPVRARFRATPVRARFRATPVRARFRALWLVVVAGLAAALAGCGHAPPVRPWQREHLAKRGMRLDAPGEAEENRFRQHWLGSREGSDLGYGEPGGGCGCN